MKISKTLSIFHLLTFILSACTFPTRVSKATATAMLTARALYFTSMALSRILDVHLRIKLNVPSSSNEAEDRLLQSALATLNQTKAELRAWKHG